MPEGYRHLTHEERCQIGALKESGLSDGDRRRLEGVAKDPRSIRKHVRRVRIIPGPGSGRSAAETIRRTGRSGPTVERWWDRFPGQGVDGLPPDAPRPPGLEPTPEEKVRAVTGLAVPPPPPHASHWTLGALAGRLELTASDVHSILRCNGPVPHQVRTSRVPRDPRVRDEGPGRRGPVCRPAGPRGGPPGRRKDADPGMWTDPEAPPDETGACGDQDARPPAQRHDLPAGGPRRRDRQGGRSDDRAAPPGGVHRLVCSENQK